MEDRCDICHNKVFKITLLDGETKNFCSTRCIKANELIEVFRECIKGIFDKYQYTSKYELIHTHYLHINERIIRALISEVLSRNYFDSDKKGHIYPKGKKIMLPRQY
ncbi:MAG TPA: hypothetical protein VJK03_01355 [Candidatus Nanoarchaeia archaeon]|nr:hypothetical protein [Candidatus Nanoarchaeia archaeon]